MGDVVGNCECIPTGTIAEKLKWHKDEIAKLMTELESNDIPSETVDEQLKWCKEEISKLRIKLKSLENRAIEVGLDVRKLEEVHKDARYADVEDMTYRIEALLLPNVVRNNNNNIPEALRMMNECINALCLTARGQATPAEPMENRAMKRARKLLI